MARTRLGVGARIRVEVEVSVGLHNGLNLSSSASSACGPRRGREGQVVVRLGVGGPKFANFYCLRQGTSKRGEGQPFLSC